MSGASPTADQSVRAASEVRRHRDDGKRRIPLVRALIGAVVVLALIGAMWTGFRALASRLGLEGSSWTGGLAALLATLVAFGLIVNVFGLFIRARHPDHFSTLIAAIRSITTGDFGVTVDIKPDNPFGPVAGEINLMVQSLKRMEEMRQEFISTASHELQSPLTSIAGFAKALRESGLAEEKRLHYLSIIEEESGRLSRLSDGAVAPDRPRIAGREPEARAPGAAFRARRADPRRRGRRRAAMDAKKIALDLDLDPVEVCADENMLAQVWTNLFHNAVKFSRSGGRIAIRLRRKGDRAIATFVDEGVGIASEDLGLVFDRFFQADRSRSKSDPASGSGLGLAIAKKIVELHGGSIRAESAGLGAGQFLCRRAADRTSLKDNHLWIRIKSIPCRTDNIVACCDVVDLRRSALYCLAMSVTGISADSSFFTGLKQETRFFIIRHGQSEGNAQRIFQGRLDMPLDEIGRAQARGLGDWLEAEGVTAIFSSSLARAAETASIAAAACRTRAVVDASFAELDTGIFTGLSFDESRERHPEIFADFQGRSWEAVPGAETAEALYERAMRAWSLLRERAVAGERCIACVSHGGFIQWLVRSTFGGRSWMPLLTTSNCGVFELLAAPRGGSGAYLQWKLINFQPAPRPA